VQPEKSISFGVTVAPGLAFSGFPLISRLVVIDGGIQSEGSEELDASARTE
jgi:hypothetical protein